MQPTQANLRLHFVGEASSAPDHLVQSTNRCTLGKEKADLDLEKHLQRTPLTYISRHHCTIGWDENGWYIEDHSLNGTVLNGERLKRGQRFSLRHNQLIQLPDTIQIEVELEGTQPLPVLPTRGAGLIYGLCQAHYEDLQYIVNQLDMLRCAHIIGPTGIGKSVILDALLQPQIHEQLAGSSLMFCYLDLYRLPDYEIVDFYHLVFNNLITRIHMEADGHSLLLIQLDELLKKFSEVRNESAYGNYLRQALDLIGRTTRRRVVFVIKHFDVVLRHLDSSIFADLREVYDPAHAWRPLFVVSTSDSLLNIAADDRARPVHQLTEMFGAGRWVKGLNQEDLAHYLTTLAQEPPLTAEEMVLIKQASGGWPALARALVFALRSSAAQLVDLRQADSVGHLLEDDAITGVCALLWSDLTFEEQTILGELVNGQTPGNPRLVGRLQVKSLVASTATGMVVLPSQLLASYITQQLQQTGETATTPTTSVIIDEVAGLAHISGKLLQIGKHLSPLEFKLLTYLASRPNQICSNDDILDNVYNDEAHELGGDMRIRRLIARLRKKVEPDPKQPKLIENVRGIGIRLNIAPEGKGI